MVSQAVPLNTLAQEDCRSRKKPRERRFALRNSLFFPYVTCRISTFYDAIKIVVLVKKLRERRCELRKLLFLRLATSRFLTFYEGVKIELESVCASVGRGHHAPLRLPDYLVVMPH